MKILIPIIVSLSFISSCSSDKDFSLTEGNALINCGGRSRILENDITAKICETDSKIDVSIKANTVIEDSIVGNDCKLGPFARIRGGTELEGSAELGNFVEANRSKVGKASKAKHLTYLGDSSLGSKVNIGAGTITCNYDGKNKHKTKLEDEVFIGSNTSLVAPVKLGKKSYTGAGSVITKNVPPETLAIGRSRQSNIKRKK